MKPPYLYLTIACTALLFSAATSTARAETEVHFSTEQVDTGKAIYKEACQLCHGTSLANGQFGTPLKGSYFTKRWAGKSVGELMQFIYESMPPDNKMTLTPEQYSTVLAYILSKNKLLPSEIPLAADYSTQSELMLPWAP